MDAGLPQMLGAMLAAGLASGVHCVGMCGGIVAAFDA
jgi:sulfite exporter TauE/SafE